MKYLPFENITYCTKLESEEILKRLKENIEPTRHFRRASFYDSIDYKHYEGSVSGNSFSMTRIIGYRNSFLPRINGVVEKDYRRTLVKVKMTLHPLVLIFMIFWIGAIGLAFLVPLISMIRKGSFESVILIPFAMLLFGYGLTTGGFKYESIKSKKYLFELFEAENEREK